MYTSSVFLSLQLFSYGSTGHPPILSIGDKDCFRHSHRCPGRWNVRLKGRVKRFHIPCRSSFRVLFRAEIQRNKQYQFTKHTESLHFYFLTKINNGANRLLFRANSDRKMNQGFFIRNSSRDFLACRGNRSSMNCTFCPGMI